MLIRRARNDSRTDLGFDFEAEPRGKTDRRDHASVKCRREIIACRPDLLWYTRLAYLSATFIFERFARQFLINYETITLLFKDYNDALTIFFHRRSCLSSIRRDINIP